ncbi:DNA polymerase III subunit delta' [Ancrocorticia populi]|uniref:DNA polymerase III subunit delta n=1 Tax=Ancrocorticia populi TaxID=2175228 RepID=A0A2V1K9U0_9ACTO|nr:DNA polymerase III subunit delta' [Ancrocorticia populi]PWF27070.1 DNA polymerase III subunit delta' [Ancrocorticia populi]
MSVFDELAGQAAAREQLERAAAASRLDRADSSMTQAWLFTGPPGSGRSNAARALAASLECTGPVPGCGECSACRNVMAGNHPDVEIVATHGVTITVDQTRSLVGGSYMAPGVGRWRVIIVEDADRMAERTTNVLLKAIEEPPPTTIWILCTPSPEDVMQTIRSRCRGVNLVVPAAEDVADLLVRRDGVDPAVAIVAARAAQSHIGRARALALDPQAGEQRQATLRAALSVRGAADAIIGAQRIMNVAVDVAGSKAGTSKDEDIAELKRSLGIEDGARVPPAVRAQIREVEEEHKRRATRAKRDELDRAMVDILSIFRDVLTVQLGADIALVNADFSRGIEALAEASTPEQSVERMDAIALARKRLAGNVDPLLAVEAMMMAFRPQA